MICGVDVGKTGAIAILYDDDGLVVKDMPVIDKEINGAALAVIFSQYKPDHIYIEAVNSFGMGRQSAFNFGQGVGVLKGVIATLQLPWSPVSPQRWKKFFHLNRDKGASRAAATRLFPAYANLFERVKDDGRAEAALIALWAQQTEQDRGFPPNNQ